MLRRLAILRIIFVVGSILLSAGCNRSSIPEVVVYTSQDRVYAEPIFSEFTRQSGIRVNALFDTEAAKTVGLVSRLLAEKSHPQCDLFWNNEELRTWQLVARGVVETNWVPLGYRVRQIVVNTNRSALLQRSFALSDLDQPWCSGKFAFASPLFGTTATYFLALRQYWGDQKWHQWCRAIAGNKPLIVSGNSDVVNFVARGEAWFGLTDSDDIAAAKREQLPVAMRIPTDVPPMLIPNTLALVVGRPHPEAGQRLLQFLQRPEVAARLVDAHALESSAPAGSVTNRLEVDYERLVRDLDPATEILQQVFLK